MNTSPKSPLFNILMNLCEEPHNKWTNNAVSTVISALNGNIFSMLALIPMYLSIRFFSKKDSPQFQLYAHLTRKNKTPSTYMDILKQLADPPGILSLVRIICKSDVLSLLKEIQKNQDIRHIIRTGDFITAGKALLSNQKHAWSIASIIVTLLYGQKSETLNARNTLTPVSNILQQKGTKDDFTNILGNFAQSQIGFLPRLKKGLELVANNQSASSTLRRSAIAFLNVIETPLGGQIMTQHASNTLQKIISDLDEKDFKSILNIIFRSKDENIDSASSIKSLSIQVARAIAKTIGETAHSDESSNNILMLRQLLVASIDDAGTLFDLMADMLIKQLNIQNSGNIDHIHSLLKSIIHGFFSNISEQSLYDLHANLIKSDSTGLSKELLKILGDQNLNADLYHDTNVFSQQVDALFKQYPEASSEILSGFILKFFPLHPNFSQSFNHGETYADFVKELQTLIPEHELLKTLKAMCRVASEKNILNTDLDDLILISDFLKTFQDSKILNYLCRSKIYIKTLEKCAEKFPTPIANWKESLSNELLVNTGIKLLDKTIQAKQAAQTVKSVVNETLSLLTRFSSMFSRSESTENVKDNTREVFVPTPSLTQHSLNPYPNLSHRHSNDFH